MPSGCVCNTDTLPVACSSRTKEKTASERCKVWASTAMRFPCSQLCQLRHITLAGWHITLIMHCHCWLLFAGGVPQTAERCAAEGSSTAAWPARHTSACQQEGKRHAQQPCRTGAAEAASDRRIPGTEEGHSALGGDNGIAGKACEDRQCCLVVCPMYHTYNTLQNCR